MARVRLCRLGPSVITSQIVHDFAPALQLGFASLLSIVLHSLPLGVFVVTIDVDVDVDVDCGCRLW